jgi:hypothetical protein
VRGFFEVDVKILNACFSCESTSAAKLVAQQRHPPTAILAGLSPFLCPFCRPLGSFVSQSTRNLVFSVLAAVRSLPGNSPSTTKQPSDQGINQRLAFLTLNANITKNLNLPAMASSGTMRGTPKGRGTVPAFTNSPAASSIPRPALESHPSGSASEAGGSTMSASRQKQSKRDEVCLTQLLALVLCTTDNIFTGYSEEDRDGS